MIETRGFNGKLNTDDNAYRVDRGDYVDALNITRDSEGAGQDEVVSNIVGNTIVNTGLVITNEIYIGGDESRNYLRFSGIVFPGIVITIYFEGLELASQYTTIQYSGDVYYNVALGLENNNVTGVTMNATQPNVLEILFDDPDAANHTTYTITYPALIGTNKVIGNYADKVRNRIYYFIWNSSNYHKIMYYDGTTNSLVAVMQNLIDTNSVNVLNFNASYRINHIDLIYRDQGLGDLLFWTDGLNPPRKINVERAVYSTTGGISYDYPIVSSYLDVAKEPPTAPPYCCYYDDATVTLNNLNNKQFKFKYRYVFDDGEKSVTSAQCEVPIPRNYSAQSVISNPTINSNIFMVLETGPANVTKIEILGAESLGTTYSDFFLITVLDKEILGLDSNSITSFRFYNDQAYNTIPLDESIQPFDIVPQKAYAQSLPNGNVLDYGAITENYDLITATQTLANVATEKNTYYIFQTGVAVAYQVNPTLTTTGIKIIVGGQFTTSDTIFIYIVDNGTIVTRTITVTAPNAQGAVTSIYTLIKNSFVSAGYTVTPSTPDSSTSSLLITKSGHTLNVYTPAQVTPDAYAYQTTNSSFAYDWASRYGFGVVYFDDKGRTNGVITTNNSIIETVGYNEQEDPVEGDIITFIPDISLSINNRPPLWASYYEIVRTKNLTKSNFLYWISIGTFKDTAANEAGYQYAYISIGSLTQYIIDNPEIKTLGYEFAAGDRIKFVKHYINGLAANPYIYTNKDYEILASLTNPIINGSVITGQVLKIVLPATDTNFDFGTFAFANYLIELYTPASSFSTENLLYYEFGQKYEIFNAGLSTAYHQGQIQNQTSNLSLPATFNFYKGDSYFRYRKYPTGGEMKWQMGLGIVLQYGTQGGTLISDANVNPAYTANSTLLFWDGYHTANKPSTLITINTPGVYTFKFTGSISLYSGSAQATSYIRFIAYNASNVDIGSATYNLGSIAVSVVNTDLYSVTLTVPNTTTKIAVEIGGTRSPGNYIDFDAEITNWTVNAVQNTGIFEAIIDPNFSDTYDSSASPNGRAWKFDPNAKQNFNPTLIRYGGEFQAGTTINNINRFYEKNFDNYDRSRGSIKKMFIEGRNQYIFQEFDVGVVTVLTQIVKDTAGNPLSAQSDTLLNKIVYPYIGGYGIGNVPESFAYGKHSKYFVDNNKGVVCRLSSDGITPLSIIYKMNNYFVEKLKLYNSNLNTSIPSTGTPTVYGAFDAYTNKYIIALEEIVRGGSTLQTASTIAFLESRKANEGFETFVSYYPENMGALNNLFVTFKNGYIYTHNSSTYNYFYGVQYGSYIDVVFNDQPIDRKTFLSITETANAIWYCPSIKSQVSSGTTATVQQTAIVAARFANLEGQYSSAIPRDQNSPGGIVNGNTMHGNYLIVRFQKDSANVFYYINTVSLNYNNSPLNLR